MKDVMILIGAGQIGIAIARRMGYGMKNPGWTLSLIFRKAAVSGRQSGQSPQMGVGCGSDYGAGEWQEAGVSEKPGQVTGQKSTRRMRKKCIRKRLEFEKTVEESYVLEYTVVEERNLYHGKDRYYYQGVYGEPGGLC